VTAKKTAKKKTAARKCKSRKKEVGKRRYPKKSLRRKYIDVSTNLSMGVSADVVSEIIDDLQNNHGWKDVQYHKGIKYEGSDLYTSDVPPHITGRRLQTDEERTAEEKRRQATRLKKEREKCKKDKEEVGLMRRLAKKHGYKLVAKDKTDES